MGSTTFSGPIKSGTVRDGSSANVGNVVLSQTGVAAGTDAKTSGAAQVRLFTLPAGARILSFLVDITTALSGNSVSGCTLKIGTTADDDHYLTAVAIGVTAVRAVQATVDAGLVTANIGDVGTTDVTLYATLTAATGNPTAGAISITALYVQD